jgi:uncharacterized protein YhbP (UPF0306 family)
VITDIEQTIREYLPDIYHLSLATTKNGIPWICEVHYVFDDDLNLYFLSRHSRRHSIEIEQNSNVAGSIVRQHGAKEKVRGVFFEGKAELLEGVDDHHIAYKLYCGRFGTDASILTQANKADGRQFYKISVKKYYIFDSIETAFGKKYELVWQR